MLVYQRVDLCTFMLLDEFDHDRRDVAGMMGIGFGESPNIA